MVVVHTGDAPKVVHHDVETTVIVQICESYAVVQRRQIESPSGTYLIEFQISLIAEGDHGCFQRLGQHVDLIEFFVLFFLAGAGHWLAVRAEFWRERTGVAYLHGLL